MSPILYGHPESGHTYKVALALELAGIEFEYRWVDVFMPRERRAADFQAASRHGEIPVLVDDGEPLVQSNSILLHLAATHRTLGGEDAHTLAQAREWLFWEANRIGLSLPNLRHYLRFEDARAPQAVFDWLRARLQLDLRRLEQELSARHWLVGPDLSIVDIACFAYLCYDDIKLDLGDFPRLREWMKRIRALPRWRHPHDLLGRPA
jgi:glutathione S-transferase